jgi:hypothetical protein
MRDGGGEAHLELPACEAKKTSANWVGLEKLDNGSVRNV